MIRFELDLGNVPSVLRSLQDPALAAKAAKAMAESYNDDIHDWIGAGNAFAVQEREGQLAQNINWRPISGGGEVYVNSGTHRARDENGHDLPLRELASYLEYGTGTFAGHRKWVIRPKPGRKGLKIMIGGVASPVGPQLPGRGYILRRSVIHPGSRAFPFFFADAAARSQRMQQAARSVLATQGGISIRRFAMY